MAPFDIVGTYGKALGYITALIIGLGFGAVLEMSGFGDSRRLAAQFYFKEMRVLKVMFTAIIVAMTLIFFTSSIGITDFHKLFVNPTYLVPGIVGGLIMGIGFIIGGFCPGTSLVAASTGKIDGMFFVSGVTFGVFVFGESVSSISDFFHSTSMGRFTLDELFGLDAGIVVVMVLIMAYSMFYGGELLEQKFGQGKEWKDVDYSPFKKKTAAAGIALLTLGLVTMAIGQPSPEQRWKNIEAAENPKLENRSVFAHPGEVLGIMNDSLLYCKLLDVRSEQDFNLFHLEDAVHVPMPEIRDYQSVKKLLSLPANAVIFLVSNDEKAAIDAYKILRAYHVANVYILEGGINTWLETFGIEQSVAVPRQRKSADDTLAFEFTRAAGALAGAANPLRGYDPGHSRKLPRLAFTRKVKVTKKKAITGGCG